MRKKTKVLLVAVLTLTLMMALTSAAQADDYSKHWSAQYIDDAASRGWMTGDGSGNFRPDAPITRGEFAVMLWRALGQPEPNGECPFNDVAANAYYYKAVTALFEKGVVNGLSATSFGPNVTLTREMGCTMLARALKLSPKNLNAYLDFADSGAISPWAREAISALVEKNYIAGVGDNKVAPKQQLKRGEMAKLLITVFDGTKSAQSAATAQQSAVTAITAYVSGPTITVKQTVLGSDEVKIAVTAKDDWGVTFVGWRYSEKDATYKSKTGFKELSGDLEFSIDENGWYAVYSENKNGYGNFKLFEVTTIREESPKVSLTQKTIAATGLVEITITVKKAPSGAAIEFVGFRKAKEGDTFSNKSGFDDKNIVSDKFTIDPTVDYGWYAGCAGDKDGKFGYRLIEVKKATTKDTAPEITTASLPKGTVGTLYTQTLAADGTKPITWSISSGTLPAGLSINASTGVISGTPTTPGTFDFQVKAENSIGSVTKSLSIIVEAVVVPVTYTITFNANGGNGTMTSSTVIHGDDYTIKTNTFTHDTHAFDGWNTEADGSGTDYADDDTIFNVQNNITLYAQWI